MAWSDSLATRAGSRHGRRNPADPKHPSCVGGFRRSGCSDCLALALPAVATGSRKPTAAAPARTRPTSLLAFEFIWWCLQQVLPWGLVRIGHHGPLANRHGAETRPRGQALLSGQASVRGEVPASAPARPNAVPTVPLCRSAARPGAGGAGLGWRSCVIAARPAPGRALGRHGGKQRPATVPGRAGWP